MPGTGIQLRSAAAVLLRDGVGRCRLVRGTARRRRGPVEDPRAENILDAVRSRRRLAGWHPSPVESVIAAAHPGGGEIAVDVHLPACVPARRPDGLADARAVAGRLRSDTVRHPRAGR